jgi:Na+-driven multidrug efflux pump
MSAYVPGITAMKISLISPVFLAIANSYTNFLNTINKQFYVLLIQGAAIIINILLNIILIKMGLGIKGVAVATAFTYFFYCLMVKLTSHAFFSKKPNLIQTTE